MLAEIGYQGHLIHILDRAFQCSNHTAPITRTQAWYNPMNGDWNPPRRRSSFEELFRYPDLFLMGQRNSLMGVVGLLLAQHLISPSLGILVERKTKYEHEESALADEESTYRFCAKRIMTSKTHCLISGSEWTDLLRTVIIHGDSNTTQAIDTARVFHLNFLDILQVSSHYVECGSMTCWNTSPLTQIFRFFLSP